MTRARAAPGRGPVPPPPRWASRPPPDPVDVDTLVGALRLPRTVCAVLAARGVTRPDDAKRFLRPLVEHLHDAAAMADAEGAADRIARAVRSGETILVHGDYDVDGICATALYTRWLRSLGGTVVPFVPHRLRDGYDFGEAGLEAARAAGATLIVTADCGTVAAGPVARARAEGRDVVVTDHHTVGRSPARPGWLVNPAREDCGYPDAGLCGTGVAYKLCGLVGARLGADPGALTVYLDLVALATVADLVPLTGENRVLLRFGLRRFAHTAVPGIAALLETAEVDPAAVTPGMLGYRVAPRINAAGRIGETEEALRLLLTDDPEEARALAARLDEVNRTRREEDRRTLEEALDLLERDYDPDRDLGVVLASEGWHPGVIGIVASRVVERIHRPVVMIALDGDRGRGSARSIPGFDLYRAVEACAPWLRRFGGHEQAAGMDLDARSVDAFRDAFREQARAALSPELLRPRVRADLELDPAEADLDLVHWLDYLGPHGIANPKPVFVLRGITPRGARTVGRGHLQVALEGPGGHRLDAIGFGLAERWPPESLGEGRWDVLVRLDRDDWRGRVRLRARLVDLRPAAADDAG